MDANEYQHRLDEVNRYMQPVHPNRDTYEEYLIRSNAEGNRFTFRRDFVISGLMTKYEALFYQDLVNRAGMRNTKKDEDGFFLCTVEFLWNSLQWDAHTQTNLLKAFKKKGFLDFKNKGLPKRRWVKLYFGNVEEALDRCRDTDDPQSSEDEHDQSRVNTRDCSRAATRIKKKSTTYSSNRKKKHTLAQAREGERSTTFLDEENQPSTFGQRLAKILITRLSEENKLFRKVTPQSRASWARQLDLLVKEVQGGEVFVEEIIHDHLDNLRNRFQPECYSAAKIRKRFDELVHARKRRTEENPHSVPEFTECRYQTKDGRTIIECTRTPGASR